MPARLKRTTPPKPAAKAPDETLPSREQRWAALMLKFERLIAEPHRCRRRLCRRTRLCMPPKGECLSPREAPEMTPEQEEAGWEDFKRAILRRAKELGVA